MNRKFIVITLLAAAAVFLISFGVRNFVAKRSARVADRRDKENRESLLELADRYNSAGDYLKAKAALEEFGNRSSGQVPAAQIRKDIEDLNIKILFSDTVTDDSFLYEIKAGDTLSKIASGFNTTVELLKKSNSLKTDIIIPGKLLKVTKARFSILVDRSDNTLALMKSGGETIKNYRVSTGKDLSTPTGTFKIEEKLVSPVWYKVGVVVKPDNPDYELGSRWMGLSKPEYGIHGTKNPFSIGQHITRGCIRMRNKDVEEVYAIVPSGTEVTIVE